MAQMTLVSFARAQRAMESGRTITRHSWDRLKEIKQPNPDLPIQSVVGERAKIWNPLESDLRARDWVVLDD